MILYRSLLFITIAMNDESRASNLFLEYPYFNIYKQIPSGIRIPPFSDEFVHR